MSNGGNNGNWGTSPQVYSGALGQANSGAGGAQAGSLTSALNAALIARTSTPFADASRRAPREGIRAGEIISWRCWHVEFLGAKANGYRLISVVRDNVWEKGIDMEGDVDEWGVFSYKDAERLFESSYYHNGAFATVAGTVYLWGEIVEHEHGYRSQRAAIRHFEQLRRHDGTLLPVQLGELRRQFGVENVEAPEPVDPELLTEKRWQDFNGGQFIAVKSGYILNGNPSFPQNIVPQNLVGFLNANSTFQWQTSPPTSPSQPSVPESEPTTAKPSRGMKQFWTSLKQHAVSPTKQLRKRLMP